MGFLRVKVQTDSERIGSSLIHCYESIYRPIPAGWGSSLAECLRVKAQSNRPISGEVLVCYMVKNTASDTFTILRDDSV